MKRQTPAWILAIWAVVLSGTLVWGQVPVPKLTDAIVQRIIPVMKAEAAQTQASLNQVRIGLEQFTKLMEEKEQLIKDLEAGNIDPLAYLKQHSKHITVPPSASYKPKLSREVSLAAYGNPIAVFSFGIEASEAARILARGGEAAAVQLVKFGDMYKGTNGQKIKVAENEFLSFYKAKGFSNFIYTKFPGWSCDSPDGSIWVWFRYWNVYAGAKNVEAFPDGPILEFYLSVSSSADPRLSPMENSVPTGKEAALKQAGISEEEYGEYLGALLAARNDAADPSAIDSSNMEFGVGDVPADPEMAKTLKDMKASYEVRRQNVLIYKKFAAVLDPLFTTLGQ